MAHGVGALVHAHLAHRGGRVHYGKACLLVNGTQKAEVDSQALTGFRKAQPRDLQPRDLGPPASPPLRCHSPSSAPARDLAPFIPFGGPQIQAGAWRLVVLTSLDLHAVN